MIQFLKDAAVGILSLMKGMAITFKYCFRPAVTIQYPTEKQPMADRYRGLVDLHREKCITCYQCVKICPTACLAITHKDVDAKKVLATFKYTMELCCFCGLCQQTCPTRAVYMNKLYEIAVYDRKKLDIDLLDPERYSEWTAAAVK